MRSLAILAAVLFLVGTAVDYVAGTNSDAMSFAEARIRDSAAIRQRVGDVTDVRLKLWGYGNKTGVTEDRSELRLRVKGTHGSTDLDLRLEGHDANWRICDASVPL